MAHPMELSLGNLENMVMGKEMYSKMVRRSVKDDLLAKGVLVITVNLDDIDNAYKTHFREYCMLEHKLLSIKTAR